MKTEKYHLYVAPFNEKTAEIALNEAYSKATKTHILIYRKGKCPDGYKEMKEADLYLLPASDAKWLREINMMLIQKFMMKNREKQEKANIKFLNDFEKELEIEREKLKKQESTESVESGEAK